MCELENMIEIREIGYGQGMPQRLEFVSRYCIVWTEVPIARIMKSSVYSHTRNRI